MALLLLSYLTFFDILSGDLHIWSSSQWPSSGCCSHWVLPHLLSGTCLFPLLWLLYLVDCEVYVYLLLSWNPTVLLLAHSLLLYLVCVHTRIWHPPWFHSVWTCPDVTGQLLDCACYGTDHRQISDLQVWYVLLSLVDYDTSCINLCDLLSWYIYCGTWCSEPDLVLLLWVFQFYLWVHCASSTGITFLCLSILFPGGFGIFHALFSFQTTCLSSSSYSPSYTYPWVSLPSL